MPLKTFAGDLPPGRSPLNPQKLHNFFGRCMGANRVRRVGGFDEHEFGGLNAMPNLSHGGLDVLHVNLRLQIA